MRDNAQKGTITPFFQTRRRPLQAKRKTERTLNPRKRESLYPGGNEFRPCRDHHFLINPLRHLREI